MGMWKGGDHRTNSNFALFLRITHYELAYILNSVLVRDIRHMTRCCHLLPILLVSRKVKKIAVKNKEPNHKK